MALTPEEIVSYELKQAVRGYSISQVDDLLDQLADQVEAEQLERQRLASRLREAEQRIDSSREAESTLNRTLITAQQAAERSLQEARQEADELVAQAREQAQHIEEEAQQERVRLVDDARRTAAREAEEARLRRAALQERIDELLERERRHRTRLRELLERELDDLDRFEETEADPDLVDTDAWSADEVKEGEEFPAQQTVPPPTDGTGPEDVVGPDDVAGPGERDGDSPVDEQDTDATTSRDDRHGLRVRVHGRVDDPGSDSPLGSPSVRDED